MENYIMGVMGELMAKMKSGRLTDDEFIKTSQDFTFWNELLIELIRKGY